MNILQHFDILGRRVRDRITGLSGVAVSLSFDLYGCIQVVVHPGLDGDGKPRDQNWFDINRLEAVDPAAPPVMERPRFEWTPEAVSAGEHGPADKPAIGKA
jgi:hypothetical protein